MWREGNEMIEKEQFLVFCKGTNESEKQDAKRNEEWSMIYLISCVLSETKPDVNQIVGIDLAYLYRFAKFHSLSAIVYMALEYGEVFTEKGMERFKSPNNCELVRRWKEDKEKAIRKNLLLNIERKKICDYLETENIWYMPLKGIVLQGMYPKTGMRQMADNDILFDARFRYQLCEWMKSRGYEVVIVEKGNHDVYKKLPVYNFEMHTALFGEEYNANWTDYYSGVRKKLFLNETKKNEYHFSEEDLYIYMIAHTCKHFNGSGTGIRSLIDVYVYLVHKEQTLDWNYVERELQKLHLKNFEQKNRQLCKKIFGNHADTLTEEENSLLKYYLESGAYGTIQKRIQKDIYADTKSKEVNTKDKLRYLKKRIFPDEDYLKKYVPFVYKHKEIKIIWVIFRIMRGILRNGRNIILEVKIVLKM